MEIMDTLGTLVILLLAFVAVSAIRKGGGTISCSFRPDPMQMRDIRSTQEKKAEDRSTDKAHDQKA